MTKTIVGAGNGLGNGVAEKFGTNGFLHTQVGDASDFKAFSQCFEKIVKSYGVSGVLFYNVGVAIADEKCEITAETLVQRHGTDISGCYNCINAICTKESMHLPHSMDKAALRAIVQELAPVFKEKGIYIGTVQVTGVIGSNEHFSTKAIIYTKRETNETIYI